MFFESWINLNLTDENICYDVTSISSYSKTMMGVEYEYNRDNEKLLQYNIGVFCKEISKLPIYYNRYNGSLTDKTNLSYVLENARQYGIKDPKLILDGGFVSKNCFCALQSCCKIFTVGITMSLKITKEMLSRNLLKIQQYENKLPDKNIFCVQENATMYGVSGKLLLYFDPSNQLGLCEDLYQSINTLGLSFAQCITMQKLPQSAI